MKNTEKIKTLNRQFSQTMDGKLFQLQATPEILRSIFWWSIFKGKRILYFVHLHEVLGYAVRPAYKKACEITRKELMVELKAAGYYK